MTADEQLADTVVARIIHRWAVVRRRDGRCDGIWEEKRHARTYASQATKLEGETYVVRATIELRVGD